FQDGTPPFLPTGGEFRLDAGGNPEARGGRDAPFVVTFPKRAMPAAGFPLLFYVHGTGGLSTQVYARGEEDADGAVDEDGGPAEIAAERGWGASGMGGFLSVEHLGALSLDGYVYNNIFNPPAMRDNFMQMVAEHMLFRRLLLDLRVDPALCPGADASAAPDGRLRFDPGMNAVIGQSLGGFLTSLLMAVEPMPWQGAIPLATGGTWTLFPLEAEDPPLGELVEDLLLDLPEGEHLDPWHPVLAAVQMALGPSENTRFLRYVLRAPVRGRAAPHVLHIQGYKDLQTSTGLQRPVVSALGVDMVGPEVGPFPDGQILPAVLLAGGRQLPYPASLNVEVPGQGPRTAVVARYEEDGVREGHYVSFQREEP
ncbi:MAG: hypothetical protein K8I02_10315, partial [Candidatus Methylomirabilis sp.]|nr:hypothetical protein [Deltaproteobacteria bacterium]